MAVSFSWSIFTRVFSAFGVPNWTRFAAAFSSLLRRILPFRARRKLMISAIVLPERARGDTCRPAQAKCHNMAARQGKSHVIAAVLVADLRADLLIWGDRSVLAGRIEFLEQENKPRRSCLRMVKQRDHRSS